MIYTTDHLIQRDPGQMYNLEGQDDYQMLHRPSSVVRDRLDALLMVLKSCKGKTCQKPWNYLHPEGNVQTLRAALDPEYDEFYSRQPKIAFGRCEFGYIADAEGMQQALTWDP